MIILSNVFIIEIGNPKIKNDGKDERKIKNCKINTVAGRPYFILNFPVETQNKNGFDEQVQNK